ncbi:MAG: hypothetical protein VXW31_00365, partial [Planctomycetota bacterium]|nr:hypothetical protein [Planctomycetota bacterium]
MVGVGPSGGGAGGGGGGGGGGDPDVGWGTVAAAREPAALGLLHCTAKKTPPTKQMSTKPNEAGERCGSATASACACRRLGVRRDPSSMCRSSSSGTKETVRF